MESQQIVRAPKGRGVWVSAAVLAGALVLAGCSSTRMVETWKADDLKPADLDFEKVIAIAITPDEARQRIAEDTLAASAERVPVVAAHRILGSADRRDVERLRAELEAQGFDGAVVVRMLGSTDRQRWVPGTTSGGFYGYYGGYAGRVYDPGYMVTDTEVQIETSLHDIQTGKLLWSGVSETLNPTKVEKLIEEVVKAAAKSLRKDGLLE